MSGPPLVSIGDVYLLAGYATATNQSMEPLPASLEPVRDVVVYTSDPGPGPTASNFTPWCTDHKGVLYPLSPMGDLRPTTVHHLADAQKFHIPPPDVLLRAWASDPEKWPKKLADLLSAKVRPDTGIELQKYVVGKKHLRMPEAHPSNDSEQAYAEWYRQLSGSAKLFAFVLPKTRAVVFIVGDPRAAPYQIEVSPPDGKPKLTRRFENEDDLTYATVIGTPQTLPPGPYTLRVWLPKGPSTSWSQNVASRGFYELRETVRFAITNFAGEFDVVTCDPISVEESVMQQFPALYSHVAVAAKARGLYPDMELDVGFASFPDALKGWAERVAWAHGKASLAVDLVNADSNSKRAKKIGKAVWKAIKPENELLAATKNTIDLAFGVKKAIKEWKEILGELRVERELAGVQKVLWKDLGGTWQRYRWWKYMKKEYVEGDKAKVLSLASVGKKDRRVIYRAGIPEKRSNLQAMIGDRPGRAVPKVLAAASTAIDVANLALAFNDVLESRKKLEDLKTDFEDLIGQVDSVLARAPCREAIGNLERMRTATVAADLELDEEEAKALMASVDLVLGVLTVVGIGGAALGAVVLAKETAGLVKDVVCDLGEWADRAVLHGFLQDSYARLWRKRADLVRASASNQALMPSNAPNGGKDDLAVQFRVRAEALNGLVGLLTRAAVSSGTEAAYLEKVKKYRVQDYIDHLLLRDGWQITVRPIVPISLDAWWLNATSPFSAAASVLTFREQFGFAKPLTSAAVNAVPGGMTMVAVVDQVLAGNAVASFHAAFPIQRVESASMEALAKAFRSSFPELGHDAVDYTCVYSRPRDSTNDADWKPVNAKGSRNLSDLPILSPFDQVRVLLVLKQSVKDGIYAVSFQVNRLDGLDVRGPVYREITRRLDAELLDSERSFKGRQGCVFHPFYQFGPKVFPGLKPLAGSGVEWAGVGLYHLLGYLDDMRYEIVVRLGDSSSGSAVTLGGPNLSRSDLDELRLGIRDRPDERRLLIPSFLRGHAETFEYPTLFGIHWGAGPCFARIGGAGQPYRLATPEEDANLVFENFDWNQPVEFILVAWSEQLATDDYDKADVDWMRVPVEVELANFTGFDQRGPAYAATLDYVGKLVTATKTISPGPKPPDGPVADWVTQMRSDPRRRAELVRAVDPPQGMATQSDWYHLYAAHIRPDYWVPSAGGAPDPAAHRQGLRPFGKVLTYPDFYRIGIRNIRTAKASGLEQKKIEAPKSSAWTQASGFAHPEYEFHFQAPRSHAAGVPWARVGADEKALRRWIEDESAKRNPNLDIVKR